MINRLKNLSVEFKNILKESSCLADSLGFKVYLVGGVVRDLILEKKVFDLDIVVQGDAIVFAGKLSELLGEKFQRHHSFGTATVNFNAHKIDFATARTEIYSKQGVLPKVSPASITEDLFRRDFTINAMAISLNGDDYGKLIDLHDGFLDLKKKFIRVLHEKSFLDDPTRILRAIRFEQRFNFKFEDETYKLIKSALNSDALKFVSHHRLRDEIVLMLKESNPSKYIKRIHHLAGFCFINGQIKLEQKDLDVFFRIEHSLNHYHKRLKKHRILQAYLIYLAGILCKLPLDKVKKTTYDLGLKKGEAAIIYSIRKGLLSIKTLKNYKTPHIIYKTLKPYSLESILFFYAYYGKDLKRNIEFFLNELADIKLKIRGNDLKRLGFKPLKLYSEILKKLLYVKIDKRLKTKKEELSSAQRIFYGLSQQLKN